MQAGGEDDDPELITLLEQALLSSSDSDAGQALGQVLQARLTEVRAVPSIAARLWHTFFAAAAAGNRDEDGAMRKAKNKVLHVIGWDLFEALVPWARGGGDGNSSSSAMDSSSALPFSSTSSSLSPFLIPLLASILSLHSGRERLLMLQEALVLVPRRTHPSLVPWLVAQMPPALAVIPAPRRKSFLDSICRVWREETVKALAAMEEGEGGVREEDEEDEEGEEDGKGKERRPTGEEAQATLVSVLEAIEALLSGVVVRRGKMEEAESREDAAAAVVEMGYVVGVLLSLLLLVPPLPPPPPPSSSSGRVDMRPQSDSFRFAERVTAVLARALICTPLVSFETLLRHHRGLQGQRRNFPPTRNVQNDTANYAKSDINGNDQEEYHNNNDDQDDESKERTRSISIASALDPLMPASAVASTPFAWEPAGLSLAAYHLFIHPPFHRTPLLPRVLAPGYVGQLLAVPAAFLLQKPHAATCGLVLLERGTLAGGGGGDTRGGEGVLECRVPGGGGGSNHGSEGGKEGAAATEEGEEEDTWVSLIRGLTGCMIFLADDNIRQRSYLALPRVLALLTYRSRYTCLAAALPRSHHPTIQALLISLAQKTLLLATAPTSAPHSLPSSPWHHLARLRVFYAPVLSRACAAKPGVLVSWAVTNTTTTSSTSSSSTSSSSGTATDTEGQLDALLSALNFLRFLRLKGWVEEGGEEEGEWWPKLRELRGTVGEILGKPHQQRNAFRLAMVEEVLEALLGEDGRREGKNEERRRMGEVERGGGKNEEGRGMGEVES